MLTIYHNPRCSKSRETLALIEQSGQEVRVIKYLETPPDKATLRELLRALGLRAEQLVRKKEAVFEELYAGREMSEEDYLDAMVAHPVLIERPIVVGARGAALGRPPEQVLPLLR